MFFAELNVDVLAGEGRTRDRILRRDTAVVFHFYFHAIVRQDFCTEFQNLRETARGEPMIDVIADPGLEQACVGAIVQQSAAIDETFSEVSDFGDVKVCRDLVAIGQVKTWRGGWLRLENGLEFAECHNR